MRLASALRPVGEPLPPPDPVADVEPAPFAELGYESVFVGSGTQALALAMRSIAQCHNGPGGPPRVLLPAYGCPDLVAAAIHAGMWPLLVDTQPGSPHMALSRAESRMRQGGVAAVVVPHFLGLPADLAEWRDACDRWSVALIEDSAQLLPGRAGHQPKGDFVVLSFGRGKPLNAGGGGALLTRVRLPGGEKFDWKAVVGTPVRRLERLRQDLVRRVFNAAIHPLPYGAWSRFPGSGLGETRYRKLTSISPMDATTAAILRSGLIGEPRPVGLAQKLFRAAFGAEPTDWVDLYKFLSPGRETPLLRYPLLAPDAGSRDAAVNALHRFGVSPFYARALPEVQDMPDVELDSAIKARDFAARLLTLPVHSAVTERDVQQIVDGLLRLVRRQT